MLPTGTGDPQWTRSGEQISLGLTYRWSTGERLLAWPSHMGVLMPTYEYRCLDCHNVFDRTEPLAEHGHRRPECPKCKSKKVEQVFTPFFAKTSHKS